MSDDTRPADTTERDEPYKDLELLRELYLDKKLSTLKIGERLDCSPNTVAKYLREDGVEIRSQPEQLAYTLGQHPNEVPLKTRADGYERWAYGEETGKPRHIYVHRLLAVAEYGLDAVADNDVHHKNGIKWDNRPENLEVLTHGDHSSTHTKISEADAKEFVRRYKEGESTYSIADDFPVTQSTVARYIREAGVEIRPPGGAKA